MENKLQTNNQTPSDRYHFTQFVEQQNKKNSKLKFKPHHPLEWKPQKIEISDSPISFKENQREKKEEKN